MIINFNELDATQRAYLRDKWSAELKELGDSIADAKSKLAKRIEKSNLSEGELTALELEVTNAKALLTHLNNTGADASLVSIQQATVTNAENMLSERKRKGGLVSDEEAILEQATIDELEWKRQYRETKIVEIDAI